MTAEQQTLAMTHIESSATRDGEPLVSDAAPPASEPTAATASGIAGAEPPAMEPAKVREIGGRKDGPEPTRFGDWERNGRCVDF